MTPDTRVEYSYDMPHTIREKEKLLNRIRRLRGQVDAIEKALEEGRECGAILQTIAACRGAMNGLMAELMEEQIRSHVLDSDARKPSAHQARAADGLVTLLRTYLR